MDAGVHGIPTLFIQTGLSHPWGQKSHTGQLKRRKLACAQLDGTFAPTVPILRPLRAEGAHHSPCILACEAGQNAGKREYGKFWAVCRAGAKSGRTAPLAEREGSSPFPLALQPQAAKKTLQQPWGQCESWILELPLICYTVVLTGGSVNSRIKFPT